MFDHSQGYRHLCSSTDYFQREFIKDNIGSYSLLEKLLGFHHEMNQPIATEYNSLKEKIPSPASNNISDELNANIAVSSLCGWNIKYLFQAIRPLEHNELHVHAAIIRTVFESIPKMFYLLGRPESTQYILCKDHFDHWITRQKYEDKINNVKVSNQEDYFEKFLNAEGKIHFPNTKITIENIFKEITEKYNNAWYRNQVYANKSLKIHDNVYSTLSASAHANLFRSITNTDYSPEYSNKFMKILTDLSYFNLILQFNAGYKVLEKINELDDTIGFIQQITSQLKTYYAMTNLWAYT